MATITARNGVNVEQLIATIGAVQQDPNVAAFTFKASSTWRSGARNEGEIKDFVHAGQPAVRPEAFRLVGDEPPVLLGSNEGPNAVELLLQALGFCYAVGYVYNAAARGIEI
ncbi:MAG: OsmC family peroxiredoxin, partial [Candidatus Limnocylindria bacterium]